MTRFHGIYAATLTPMQPDGRIDIPNLERHVGGLAQIDGLNGFLINGHAGENHLLERDEKRLVMQAARQTAGDRLIIAGVNREDSDAAAREAEDAMEAGAEAIMIFPPMSWALGHDADMVRRHHDIVAAACGAPIFLYQAPVGAGRLAYGPATISVLLDVPGIVGVKEGSWETATYEANRCLIKKQAPQVGVYASGDEHLFTCFILGSEGSIVSLAAIWPEPVIALARAVAEGDMSTAKVCHETLYPLARAIYGTGPAYRANARLKTCLKLLGRFEDDRLRNPIERLPAVEVTKLQALLHDQGHLT